MKFLLKTLYKYGDTPENRNVPGSQLGATIIEVIIYTFLSISFLLVLTDIFSSLLDKGKESVSFSEVETDAKYINQKILNNFAQATSITTPSSLNTSVGTLVFTANSVSYSYYLSGNNLYISEGGTVNQLNSYGTQISNLAFTRYGSLTGKSIIKISYDLKSTIIQAKGYEQKTVNLTLGSR